MCIEASAARALKTVGRYQRIIEDELDGLGISSPSGPFQCRQRATGIRQLVVFCTAIILRYLPVTLAPTALLELLERR